MKTIEINNINEFNDAILSTYSGHPIFRGEKSSSYELFCKYGRFAKEDNRNNSIIEREIIDEFKRSALPFIKNIPDNDWDWISLAQHHGLGTRFLDWTENPLVAAFFTYDHNLSNDSVIYVFEQYDLNRYDPKESPFDIKTDCVYYPNHLEARMINQAGVFTVHANPKEVFNCKSLKKWIIKSNFKLDLKTLLEVYKIDKKFIFPGMDSICSVIHDNFIRSIIRF